MITSHSLTFISNSSSNKSDYLRTNGTIRMSWTNWMNWMKWVSEANELNEVNEVSLTNEFCEMSEQESDFARWVRNKSEWVGWNHLLTTGVAVAVYSDSLTWWTVGSDGLEWCSDLVIWSGAPSDLLWWSDVGWILHTGVQWWSGSVV